MKKSLLHITLASIISWLFILVFSVIIVAVMREIGGQLLRNILAVILFTISFNISLLYITKIRNGIGEDELLEDYPQGKYISLKNDLRYIIQREFLYIITIAIIIMACFVVNAVYITVFGAEKVFPLTMIYVSILPFSEFAPVSESGIFLNLIANIINIIVVASSYLLTVALYRRKLHKKHKKNEL